MYKVYRTNEYLAHHGILGQKWGKRNGPPYPLGASDRSAKEQRLNSKPKNSSNKTKDDEKHKGLTDAQKKAIKIGAIAAGTALVAIGGYSLYKSGKIDALVRIGSKMGSNFKTTKSGIKIKDAETSIANFINNDMKNVNPLAKNFEQNVRQQNCIPSSIVSLARYEGLDLEALPTDNGMSFRDIGKYVYGFSPEKLSFSINSNESIENASKRAYTKLIGELKELAEFNDPFNEKKAAIGIIGGTDRVTGAQHAFNYAIENGKVHFFDSKFQIEDCSSYFFDDIDPTKILFGQLNGSLQPSSIKDAIIEIAKNRV